MDYDQIKRMAVVSTPIVNTTLHENFFRQDVLSLLDNKNSIGIELGVAGGHFSHRMIKSGMFEKFYGVDLYEDHHNTSEYIDALKLIGLDQNFVMLRMSFDEACAVFENNYFDFIYIDGYAHTGEEGGKTFSDWYNKLKIGGVFAGDDYHDDWPLVKWAVNDMVTNLGCELHITGKTEATNLNHYPSWFITKTSDREFSPCKKLASLGQSVREATRCKSQNVSLTGKNIIDIVKQACSQNPNFAAELKAQL